MGGGILVSTRIKRREFRLEGHRRGHRGGDLDEFVAIVSAWDDERVNRSNSQAVADLKSALARHNRKPPAR